MRTCHQASMWKKKRAEDAGLSLNSELGATTFRGQTDEDVPEK